MTSPRPVPVLLVTVGQVAVLGVVSLVLARVLGPAGLGAYSVALVVASLVALIVGLGTGTALRYFIAREPERPWERTYVLMSAVLAAVAGLLVAVLWYLGIARAIGIGAIVAVAMGLFAAQQSVQLLHAWGDSVVAIAAAAGSAGIALTLLAAYALVSDPSASVAAALVAAGAALPAMAAAKRWPASRRRLKATSQGEAFELVRVGVPTLGYSLGLASLGRADRLVLNAMLGVPAVGLYSAAATYSEPPRLVSNALGQVAFFRATSPDDAVGLRRLRYGAVLLTALIALALALAAPWLVPLLFGSEFTAAVPAVRILCAAEVLFALTFVESRIAIAAGRQRQVGVAGGLTALANLGLAALLVQWFGLEGAAWASLGTYALLSGVLSALQRAAGRA